MISSISLSKYVVPTSGWSSDTYRPKIDIKRVLSKTGLLFPSSMENNSPIGMREEYHDVFQEKHRRSIAQILQSYLSLGEESPTTESYRNAHILLRIFSKTIDLSKVEFWPTDHGTIEFSIWISETQSFVLETSDKGISGFVKFRDSTKLIYPDTQDSEVFDILKQFSQNA